MPSAEVLLRSVACSDDVAYVLDEAFTLARVNAGFVRFAGENSAANLLERWQGRSVFDAIPPALRAFYVAGFEQARVSCQPWEHDYECSSSATYRAFRMIVYPAAANSLVVVNSLRVERPHTRTARAPDLERYVRNGLIRMCANCRRIAAPHGSDRWDWVPAILDSTPDNVSHGLCKPCAAFYWTGRLTTSVGVSR